jgi:hypothetical protein
MIAVGSKVAYTADSHVGEPGCPMGIVIAGQVEVTMPDYTMPGPPPRNFRKGDDDHTGLAWLVAWYGDCGDEPISPVWADDMYLVEVPHYTEYKPLKPRSHTSMKKFHVQTMSDDGESLHDAFLFDDMQTLIEAALARLRNAINEVRVYGDAEERVETEAREQIGEWARNGWTGATELPFPDGTRWDIKQAALGEQIPGAPDAPADMFTDEDVDAIVAEAFSSIQWVIDDLRSWESNPESAGYNADKLADALAVIRTRERSKAGE